MTDGEIKVLTPEQEVERVEWRKKYLGFGWSTERSDRPRAEAAIVALYARKKQKAPQFVWFDSPAAAVATIRESGGGEVILSGTDGQFDSYWVSLHTFLVHIGGKASEKDKKHLTEWQALAESTGPCYPYDNFCIMTERPCIATYDDREVLHGERAPALEYLDGNRIYVVHGITVPEIVVMRPWDLTLEIIERIGNDDIQAIMQDAWCYLELDATGRHKGAGGGRWLIETEAQAIHMDLYTAYRDEKTGQEVQIQRALLLDKNGRKYLMCTDSSTDRVYYIVVDPGSKTCGEGHMSINGGIPDSDIVVSS